MLKHLEPVRLPPLLMGMCVGRGVPVTFSLFSSLPQVYLSSGPFTSPKCMHGTSGSVRSTWIRWACSDLFCAYAQPHPGICLPQTVLQSAVWAEPLALPRTSEIHTHGKCRWASPATPKGWALFKVRSSRPASCWQNLMPTELGESRVECAQPQPRMPEIPIFLTPSLTALHFSKLYAIGLWSVSRVMKWLLYKSNVEINILFKCSYSLDQ